MAGEALLEEGVLPFTLPKLERCDHFLVPSRSIVVLAAGFEDRTFALARSIAEVGSEASAVIIDYDPGDRANQLQRLVAELEEKGLPVDQQVDVIKFNRFFPDSFGEQLKVRLSGRRLRKALIDVSSMSKMAILLTLEVCRELNVDVALFYAEAGSYGPSKGDYDEARRRGQIHQPSIQVYSGIGEVVRSARLSSVAMQGEPLAAIMFMSFNELLTQALLNCIYPSRLFLINGRPPEHDWREGATAWIHEKLRTEWTEDDNPVDQNGMPTRRTSTLRYGETIATLLDLYWRLSTDYRIVLAPTGSKMQTVGVFFCRALHPDIHIEYPTPKGYLRLYTSGIGRKWLIKFGPLGERTETWQAQEKVVALGIEKIAFN